jgi:septum formation inhibitor MinC
VGSTYGAAGSLVVLLVWVYYSSVILYFGAEFTKAYAMKYATAIQPNQYAVVTKKVEVEDGKSPVQAQENKKEDNSKKEENSKKTEKTQKEEKYQKEERQHWSPMPFPKASEKRLVTEEIHYDDVRTGREKKKEVGMLTVLGGLLLYLVNSTAKEVKEVKKLPS